MIQWLRQRVGDGSLLFGLLPLLYFILYGFDGFADTDQGFVPALAWRVKSGQIPYLDFVYVRPPLTPVLHALELWIWPKNVQLLGMRLDYYLMMAGSVAFGVLALRKWIDLGRMGLSSWWIAGLGFLFGVHNFPSQPWHTVDGIFFGSMGLWLISFRSGQWKMVLGLLALALSSLAKQPFALMLPLGIGLLFYMQPMRLALRVTAVSFGILGGLTAIALLWLPDGFLGAMLSQVMGASSMGDLFKAGFVGYVLPFLGYVLPAALLIWAVGKGDKSGYGLEWLGWVTLAGLALLPFAYAGLAFWKMSFVAPRLGAYHALFFAGLAYAFLLWRDDERKSAAVLVAFSTLAWASSLSWGYAFPAMFCLPGIVGLLGILQRVLRLALSNTVLAWITGVALAGFFLLQCLPYRDGPRWTLVEGAGDVFPQLSGIRTRPESIAMMKEMKTLVAGVGGRFAVLPAQPGIHYLMGEVPAVGIDWEHDAEIGLAQMQRILWELRQPGMVVLVEQSRVGEAFAKDGHYGSQLLKEVIEHWEKVASGKYFDTYRNPE